MLSYKPSPARTLSELVELLSFVAVKAPTFEDAFFVGRNIDTVFEELDQSLSNLQKELGETRYAELVSLSLRAKAAFEADPGNVNGKAREGRVLILQMQAMLRRR